LAAYESSLGGAVLSAASAATQMRVAKTRRERIDMMKPVLYGTIVVGMR
jgi:hypothetical protein